MPDDHDDHHGAREDARSEDVPERLPEYVSPGSSAGEQWVTLSTYANRQEAHLAVAKLRAAGLHARVDGEEMAIGPFGSAPFNPKVHVLRRDAAEARTILDEIERRRVKRMNDVPCPRCGQTGPRRVWPMPRLVSLTMALAAFALMIAGMAMDWMALLVALGTLGAFWPLMPRWRCAACAHRWAAPAPDQQIADDDEDEDDEEEDEADAEERPQEGRSP